MVRNNIDTSILQNKQLDIEEVIDAEMNSRVEPKVIIDGYFIHDLINGNKRSFIEKESNYKQDEVVNLYCKGKWVAKVVIIYILPIKITHNDVFMNNELKLPLDFVAVNYEGFENNKFKFFKYYKEYEGYINFFKYLEHSEIKIR